MIRWLSSSALFTLLSLHTDAFVAPLHGVAKLSPAATNLNAIHEFASFNIADGLSAATMMQQEGEMTGALSTLRTFFIVLTAAIFGITALAYLTAAFLVPKAAEQLEQDTRRLRPGLWEEYEAKLNEGETMVNRPDLLQELGNIMQPIIVQDYEREAAIKFGENEDKKNGGGSKDSDISANTSGGADQWKD